VIRLFYDTAIYCIYIYIYIYILFCVQPKGGSSEPKQVAKNYKFKNLIKAVLGYNLLPYLINK